MMIVLLEMTAERYKFLAFFSTSALMFVAVAPNFKDKLADKVHAVSAYISNTGSAHKFVRNNTKNDSNQWKIN